MRLIDADALKDYYLTRPQEDFSYNRRFTAEDVALRIEKAPTVDSVKHGHWVAVNPDERGFADLFSCSCCENTVWTMAFTKKLSGSAYCSKCGAKMDEEVD